MSTQPPSDNPAPQDAAPTGAPPAPGAAQAKPKPPGSWWALAGVLAIALCIAGYFIGRSVESKQYDPGKDKYNAIYNAGVAAGAKQGLSAGLKQGETAGKQQGKAQGKKIGLQEGKAQGFKLGKQAGESAGETKGRQEGEAEAAKAVSGGFSNWQTGVPYVITMAPGPSSTLPVVVKNRTEMQQGLYYGICSSGSGVCTIDRTASQANASGG